MSKLLSQGGFGCIYYPGITCAGQPNKDKTVVTKLQQNDASALNEIAIGAVVRTIPNYQLFFLPVISSCPINLARIDTDILTDCEIVSTEDSLNVILMEIPYVENRPFFSMLTSFNRTKKHIILNMVETFQYLLNSIQYLIDIDIVHFDLKSPNILYSKNANNPLIIDYGISINMKTLTDDNLGSVFYMYVPEYYLWPIEVHVICYLLKFNQPLTATDINNIITSAVNNNKALEIFSPDFKNNFIELGKNYFNSFVKKSPNEVVQTLLKNYKTWDNYALSILYLKMLHYMFYEGFHRNKLIILFSQLLLLNISPLPEQRYSVEETKIKFKDLFFLDQKAEDYFTLIKSFDFNTSFITSKIKEDVESLPDIRAMSAVP